MASAKKNVNPKKNDKNSRYEDFWMIESDFSENYPGSDYDVVKTASGESKWLSVYIGYNQVQKIITKLFFAGVILQVNFFTNTSDETYNSFGDELKKKKKYSFEFEPTQFTDRNGQTHYSYEIKTDLENWMSTYKIILQVIDNMVPTKSDHFTERVQFPVPREEEASAFDFKEVFGNAPAPFTPTETKSITTPTDTPIATSVLPVSFASVAAQVVRAPVLQIDEANVQTVTFTDSVEDITNLLQNVHVSDATAVQNSEQNETFGMSFIQSQQNLLISNAFAFARGS